MSSKGLVPSFDPNSLAGVLVIAAALGLLVFAVLYTWKADWRRTPLGRHMFYFSWAFVLAYLVGVARTRYPDQAWPDYARVGSLSLVTFVVWQRVLLLIKSLRRPNSGPLTMADRDVSEAQEARNREELGERDKRDVTPNEGGDNAQR